MIFTDDRNRPIRDRIAARAGGRWYDIRAEASHATIRIYDEIGYWGTTASDFAEELDALDVDTIEVQINSPGGDVFDGLAIYNALRSHRANVTVRVDGLAASIASIIAQAGDQRIMLTGSQMMIHEASGMAWGTADTMREFAGVLEKQNVNIANIYARHGDGDSDHFAALMAAETWFTADEAVAEGLADEAVDPSPSNQSDTGSTGSRADARKVGRTFANHAETVLADLDALVGRAEEVMATRAEKGKTLSPASAEVLASVGDTLDRLRGVLDSDPANPPAEDRKGPSPTDMLLRIDLQKETP